MIEHNGVALAIFSSNMGRRKLPVGRFTVALGGAQKRAQARGSDRVAALCAAALVAAGRYVELRRQRKARRQARGGGRAMAADKRVDAAVRSIHKHLTSCVESFEGTEKAAEAQRLLDQYFPDGLGAVIAAPYEEELVMAEHLAEVFTGPEARLMADLGARIFVDVLVEVLPEYREALGLEDIVTATEVAEARGGMHLLMLRVVATILADHGDDPEAMRALLAPIEDQDRRLAEVYAARRRGVAGADLDVGSADAAQAARDAEAEALAAELAADELLDAELGADGLGADGLDADDDDEALDLASDERVELEGEAGDRPPLQPLGRG